MQSVQETMTTAVYTARSTIETRQANRPELKPGDVLLQMRACGVCGTDVRKVQHGLVKPPVVLGHEVAGEVVEVGPGDNRFAVGDRMVVAHHTPCYACHYCRHGNHSMCRVFKKSNLDPGGFSQWVRVPATHVSMNAHHIPDDMSYQRAVFMEPLACVLRALKRTTLLPGDTVLIIGLGSMGLLAGQLVKNCAAKVIASDLKNDRLEIADNLGFDKTINGNDSDIRSAIQQLTEGRGVDLVILTAGDGTLYSKVIQHVRDGGTINIFAGLAPGEKVTYETNDLYSREITIYSSYSPSPTELAEAMEHLKAGTVDVDILSPQTYPLEALSEAIEAVGRQSIIKAIITPQQETLR